MVYSWKSASRINANAQKVGEMCEELERTVGLTPQTLLDANRAEGTPLHNEFEWNDTIAAENHRRWQARHILACLCVEVKRNDKENVRAFFPITRGDQNGRVYKNLDVIFANKDTTEELLRTALRELQAFKKKYDTLIELSPVFEAIEKITGAKK